jgi:hypothetical protein
MSLYTFGAISSAAIIFLNCQRLIVSFAGLLKICELHMKVRAVMFLSRLHHSKKPGNQVSLENPNESVKYIL